MTDEEKQEVAAIARDVVLAAMKELMPTLQRISNNFEQLTAVVDKEVASHNEHADAIEQLMVGQSSTAKFTRDLGDQCGQIFKALSARIGVLEARERGAPEPPARPPEN